MNKCRLIYVDLIVVYIFTHTYFMQRVRTRVCVRLISTCLIILKSRIPTDISQLLGDLTKTQKVRNSEKYNMSNNKNKYLQRKLTISRKTALKDLLNCRSEMLTEHTWTSKGKRPSSKWHLYEASKISTNSKKASWSALYVYPACVWLNSFLYNSFCTYLLHVFVFLINLYTCFSFYMKVHVMV